MRRVILSIAITMLAGVTLTVLSSWALWLLQLRPEKDRLDVATVNAVLERECGPLIEPFGQHGMVASGIGWTDTFATSMTIAGSRQVRIVETGWPQPCLYATERPRDDRGFVMLPFVGRLADGDGRVPFRPRWTALSINALVMSAAFAGVVFGAPVVCRRVAQRSARECDAPAG